MVEKFGYLVDFCSKKFVLKKKKIGKLAIFFCNFLVLIFFVSCLGF